MARCKGINRKGDRCGSNAAITSEYCEAHQDQANKPQNKPPFFRRYKILKSLIIFIIVAVIGALVGGFTDLNIWPSILIQSDKIRGMEPKPSISMRVIEKVTNKNHLDFRNKCADFNDFLTKSKILLRLPSKKYFATTTQDIKKERPQLCEITAPFPNYIYKHMDMFFIPSGVTEIEKYPGSHLVNIIITNSGKRDIDFIRAEIRLNDNWIVNSIEGGFIEKRDINSFVIYREHITAGDSIPSNMYIENATKAKIDAKDFITDISATYGWRGVKKTLRKENINMMYTVYIENCEVNCAHKDLENIKNDEY